jgi:hypothetical protein
LADNVLLTVSAGIGLFTGLVGLIIGKVDANIFAGLCFDDSRGIAGFMVGFLVGYSFASTMTGVVVSAANTVIVLFAESPAEFQQSRPQLSEEM